MRERDLGSEGEMREGKKEGEKEKKGGRDGKKVRGEKEPL